MRIAETAIAHLVVNVRKLVRRMSRGKLTVEPSMLSSRERRGTVMGISNSATTVWILPPVS